MKSTVTRTSCSGCVNGSGASTHGVDDREERGVGADAERQRQYRDQRERAVAPGGAGGVPQDRSGRSWSAIADLQVAAPPEADRFCRMFSNGHPTRRMPAFGISDVQKWDSRKARSARNASPRWLTAPSGIAGFGERPTERRIEEDRIVAEAVASPSAPARCGRRRSRGFRTARGRLRPARARRRTRAGLSAVACARAAPHRSARTSPDTEVSRRQSAPTRLRALRPARRSTAPNPPPPSIRRSPRRSRAPWRARSPRTSAGLLRRGDVRPTRKRGQFDTRTARSARISRTLSALVVATRRVRR